MEPETLGLEARCERLFTDIADDVTLGKIVPQLSWKTIDSLASQSPAWLQAVQSREIYGARVIYDALEQLVLIRCRSYYFWNLSDEASYDVLRLYSTLDGFYFELPRLPSCEQGIPADCHCLTLDGRIYALGGKRLNYLLVYVLDLAGRKEWKQCASMLRQKKGFGCAAFNGKVYVIGSDLTNDHVSEVYDPKTDSWSVIEATAFSPSASSLTVVGEELFILSFKSSLCESWMDIFDMWEDEVPLKFASTVDIYHPVKDEWRVENISPVDIYLSVDERRVGNTWSYETVSETYETLESSALFTAKGKLYRLMDGLILCLDMDTKKWVPRHTYSFDGLCEDPGRHYRPCLVTAVGDELLALYGSDEFRLFHSEGFGGQNIRIKWRISRICPSRIGPFSPDWGSRSTALSCLIADMYPIEL